LIIFSTQAVFLHFT